MKLFIIVIHIFVVLAFGFNTDACMVGSTNTIFSKSFPASDSILKLTWQCLKKTTLSNEVWMPLLETEFVTPREKTISRYEVLLIQGEYSETVWEIMRPNSQLIESVRPAFSIDDFMYQNSTVWVFFWKEPNYYLEVQERRDGVWKNRLSVPLKRPYAFGACSTILVNGEEI